MLSHPQPVRASIFRLAVAVALSLALVVVCTAATPTAPPEQNAPSAPGQVTWPLRTSEHFEVFHNSLPADRVDGAVRDAEAAYTQLSAALKHELSRPVPLILLLRDRELPATEARARNFHLQSGAPPAQHLVISLESLDRRTGIIVHELTHQFAFDIVSQPPAASLLSFEGCGSPLPLPPPRVQFRRWQISTPPTVPGPMRCLISLLHSMERKVCENSCSHYAHATRWCRPCRWPSASHSIGSIGNSAAT